MLFPLITLENTDNEKVQSLLSETKKQLGRIPNLYSAMANSPALLEGYLHFRSALGNGVLNAKLKEQIALLTAEENACEYCVSAHIFRGGKIGLSLDELAGNRHGNSEDIVTHLILQFVKTLLQKRGQVPQEQLDGLHDAGISDEMIGEIIGHVSLNILSNYFNHVAKPELDFLKVELI